MSKTSPNLTVIVIAPDNRQELQFSLNSVLQAIQQVSATWNMSIVIFDESQLYGKTLRHPRAGQIPAVSKLAGLSLSNDTLYGIIPPQVLVSSTWLTNSLQSVSRQPIGTVLRPELYIHYDTTNYPTIHTQQAPGNTLYNLAGPIQSGAVVVSGTMLSDVIGAAPESYPLRQWLSSGAAWFDKPGQTVAGTAVIGRLTRHELGTDYLTLPLFNLHGARATSVAEPSPPPIAEQPRTTKILSSDLSKRAVKAALRKTHLLPVAKRLAALRQQPVAGIKSELPTWLIEEWRKLHRIDNRVFPNAYFVANSPVTADVSYRAQRLAYCYAKLAATLRKDRYDYIFFAPWLIRGGADKFTIEYANTIAGLRPDLNVLVVTTLDRQSEWASKLVSSVDYCDLASLAANCTPEDRHLLLELLIAQSGARTLHVINSELAYDFIASHKPWLRKHNVKVVATSFSQEVLDNGKVLGYSHSHMPEIYDATSLITSDNDTVLRMWQNDYGFDAHKLALHHLPFISPGNSNKQPRPTQNNSSFKVLWASRIAVEKLPGLVAEIGQLVDESDITIDMYGTVTAGTPSLLPDSLPANVRYCGGFNGMSTLPLTDYDAFLYTSLFDGMPNTLLEIGLAGLPIVSSAVGGIPELIQDETTGLLVRDIRQPTAYAAALRRLQADAELRKFLVANLSQKIKADYSEKQFENAVTAMLKQLSL